MLEHPLIELEVIGMENWEKINAVQRMQDFILEKINEPITLYMLSRISGYSPWHTSKIFKELLGVSPLQYIRNLRLSKAAERLKDGDERIIDIALDFAFNSHESFTRSFSNKFGITPVDYRNRKSDIKLFLPISIKDYYLKLKKGEKFMVNKDKLNTVFVQVIDKPDRKLILKRGIKAENYFDFCEEVGCDVWQVLCNIQGALYEPMGMWMPENLRLPGTSTYVQGVEVALDYNEEIPEGYEIIELKACKVMIFQGPPFKDEEFEKAILDLGEVMKHYNPELYGFRWADEDGPRIQLEPQGERGYIEARPVRMI